VPRHKAGLSANYARLVDQAHRGAVTHAGGAEWPWFDAKRPQTAATRSCPSHATPKTDPAADREG
jgi:hypothetical protein